MKTRNNIKMKVRRFMLLLSVWLYATSGMAGQIPFTQRVAADSWDEEGVDRLKVLRELAVQRCLFPARQDPEAPAADPVTEQLAADYSVFMNTFQRAMTNWCAVAGMDGHDAAFSSVLGALYGKECITLLKFIHESVARYPDRLGSCRIILSQLGRLELLVLSLARYEVLTDHEYRMIGSRMVSPAVRKPVVSARQAAENVFAQVSAQWMAMAKDDSLDRIRQEHINQSRQVLEKLQDVESSMTAMLHNEQEPAAYGKRKVAFAEKYSASMTEIKRMLRVEKHSPAHGSYFSLMGVFTYPVNPEKPDGADQSSYRVMDEQTGKPLGNDVPLYLSGKENELVLRSRKLKQLSEVEASIRRQIDFSPRAGALARLENMVNARIKQISPGNFRITDDLAGVTAAVLAALPESDRETITTELRQWMPPPEEVIRQHLEYFNMLSDRNRSLLITALMKQVNRSGLDTVYHKLIKARRQDLAAHQAKQKSETADDSGYIVRVDDYSGLPIELIYWQERYLDWKVTQCRIKQCAKMEMERTAHGYGWNGNQNHTPEKVIIKGVAQASFTGIDEHSQAWAESLSPEEKEYFTALGYSLAAKSVTEQRLRDTLRPGDHPDDYYNYVHKQLKLLPLSVVQ